MSFYLPNSDDYYLNSIFWKSEKNYLLSQHCKLLNTSQANNYDFDRFFIKNEADVKPRLSQEYNFFSLAYELDDEVNNALLVDNIIINLINDNLHNDVLLCSTDPDKCCVIQSHSVTKDIINTLVSPHLNTPFIIFNESSDFFVLIDFDLPLQIIGYKNEIIDKNNYVDNKVGEDGWNNVFQRYASYTNIPNILKEYYSFLLPKNILESLE